MKMAASRMVVNSRLDARTIGVFLNLKNTADASQVMMSPRTASETSRTEVVLPQEGFTKGRSTQCVLSLFGFFSFGHTLQLVAPV